MTTMPMFYGYMDSPFIPLPPPWVDPAESQATAKACKHFCCKARSKTDIALTVFRVFGFVFSIVMLTLGVTVFEMPHTFGSYPADNIIFITVASITCLFSLLETCCFTEGVKYPVSRGIYIIEAVFTSLTLFFSLVFSLWLVARSGDSPEGVPLIFVVFCFVSGVNAIVLFVFDLIILAHDKAFEVKHKFETTQNTDQNA